MKFEDSGLQNDKLVEDAIKSGMVTEGATDAQATIYTRYYAAISALNDKTVQSILDKNNLLKTSTDKLLSDIADGPGGFAQTFSHILATTGSVGQAFTAVWTQVKTDVTNVLGDLLNNIIKGFLQPLLDQVKSVTSQITSSIIGSLTNSTTNQLLATGSENLVSGAGAVSGTGAAAGGFAGSFGASVATFAVVAGIFLGAAYIIANALGGSSETIGPTTGQAALRPTKFSPAIDIKGPASADTGTLGADIALLTTIAASTTGLGGAGVAAAAALSPPNRKSRKDARAATGGDDPSPLPPLGEKGSVWYREII